MKRFFLYILALAATLCVPQHSRGEDKDKLIQKIASANAAYKTIVSPFRQIKKMKGVKKPVISQGVLYFSKATGQLNMQYSKPSVSQTLITGDKFVFVNGAARETYSTSSDASFKTLKWTLLYSIGGDILKAAEHSNAKVNLLNTDDYYTFELVVENPVRGGWARLELSYSKEDYSLCLMKMIEKNGNYTLYQTPKKEFNKALPDGLFNY